MKRLILLLLLVPMHFVLYAQSGHIEDSVTWVEERNNFVVTIPKSVAYEMPFNPDTYSWWVSSSDRKRKEIAIDNFKVKKLKKPQTLLVRGYANRVRGLEYDTYIVDYKGKRYLLPCEYVGDNSLIDGVNISLKEEYNTLVTEANRTKSELDSLVATHLKICEEKVLYYKDLEANLPAVIDSVRNKAKADYQAAKRAEKDAWYKALPKSTQKAYNSLSIKSARLASPNSASGCDYYFEYVNNSKKIIKYLYWEGKFYNAVNDPVYCDIRNYNSFTGKYTGPVEPGEQREGWWECIIYNWAADHVKLSKVTIVYMDGTSVVIGAGDIKRLLTEPEDATWYEEDDIVRKSVLAYGQQLNDSKALVKTWEYRLNYLQHGNFRYPSYERGEYEKIFEHLSTLYNKSQTLNEKLSKFEAKNLIK